MNQSVSRVIFSEDLYHVYINFTIMRIFDIVKKNPVPSTLLYRVLTVCILHFVQLGDPCDFPRVLQKSVLENFLFKPMSLASGVNNLAIDNLVRSSLESEYNKLEWVPYEEITNM